MGKDHTLFALQPGYIKFYSSSLPFPHPTGSSSSPTPNSPASSPTDQTAAGLKQSIVKRPREKNQFIGVASQRDEILPRDLVGRGRERKFWGAVKEQ
jgi:large subunit ribosomal protein L27